MLWLLGVQLSLAQDAPPSSITWAGKGRVVMDGRKAPLNHAKPFLIEDAGSRRRARSAKTLSTVGTITAISGAALVVLGAIGISDGGLDTNGPAYTVSGAGFVVLGTSIGFKIGSSKKWKRSIEDYQGR